MDRLPHPSEDKRSILPMRKLALRLTEYQLSKLMKRFQIDPYIKGQDKELMAKNLSVSQKCLVKWFAKQQYISKFKTKHKQFKASMENCQLLYKMY